MLLVRLTLVLLVRVRDVVTLVVNVRVPGVLVPVRCADLEVVTDLLLEPDPQAVGVKVRVPGVLVPVGTEDLDRLIALLLETVEEPVDVLAIVIF